MTSDQHKLFKAVMLAVLDAAIVEMEITPEQIQKVDMERFSDLVADRFMVLYENDHG